MKTSTSRKVIKVILSLFLVFFCLFTADRVLASDYDHYNPIEKDASSTGFETLQHLNKDVCGWISLDGTKVDYPLLQSQDNIKYLDRNKTSLRLDQVDEFLGEIDIGHLNRAPFDRTGAPRPRRAYLRDTRIRRFGEASLSDLRKATRVGKHGERHLCDRKVSPVAVNLRNDAVSADTSIVQFAHGVSVLKISLRRGRRTELRDAVNRFFFDV